MVRADGRVDRVLDGPTSTVWIDPWVKLLDELGVKMHGASPVTAIDCDGHRITGVTIEGSTGPQHVTADHYVVALPKERLEELGTPALLLAEPRLAGLPELKVSWMNGAMYYLDRDVELVDGHVLFVDSQWALTAISQAQFWPDIDLRNYGDGRVEGILSVDISDWERPGGQGLPPAKNCTKKQIEAEVWRQLADHIDDGSLQQSNVLRVFLDPAIQFPNPTATTNLEPLLINTAGSWQHRPEAVTTIPNLFLAADFVQTATDLATMEAANEAARRAVNGILKATGSTKEPCEIWPPREPAILTPFRRLDRIRWQLGRQVARPPVEIDLNGELHPTGPLSRGLFTLLNRFG
ncbi:FAD-dependent oxidoreductase [Mycolicibacterium goodii]|uniref:FAD-dependent oxidoreductase n=1 Tax=Mycolicibacterium goodii TaxID=134601 RepID=UPI000B218F92